MSLPSSDPNGCLRYWDLSDNIRLDHAVALWCGIQPEHLDRVRGRNLCMEPKREALVSALRDGRLEYQSLGLITSYGKVLHDVPVDELIEKDRLVIRKASLRRWFEQVSPTERPPFLFDESRQINLPDGSDAAEMNSQIAIAILAHLLAAASDDGYKVGQRPNATAIGTAVEAKAKEWFGPDVRGFGSFRKKVSEAIKFASGQMPARTSH